MLLTWLLLLYLEDQDFWFYLKGQCELRNSGVLVVPVHWQQRSSMTCFKEMAWRERWVVLEWSASHLNKQEVYCGLKEGGSDWLGVKCTPNALAPWSSYNPPLRQPASTCLMAGPAEDVSYGVNKGVWGTSLAFIQCCHLLTPLEVGKLCASHHTFSLITYFWGCASVIVFITV